MHVRCEIVMVITNSLQCCLIKKHILNINPRMIVHLIADHSLGFNKTKKHPLLTWPHADLLSCFSENPMISSPSNNRFKLKKRFELMVVLFLTLRHTEECRERLVLLILGSRMNYPSLLQHKKVSVLSKCKMLQMT